MTEATFAHGVIFSQGETPIGEIANISGPALKADTIDVTTHGSPDQYREFIQGLKDGGEISLELNCDPDDTGQELLPASFEAGTVDAYTIEYPNSWGWSFDALVTAFEVTAPIDGKLGCSCTLKVTGKPEFAEIAS